MRARLRRGHLVAALLGAVVAHLLLGSAFAARITHSPGRPPGSLFLDAGTAINFDAGDITLTHSADTLTLAGGQLVAPDGSAALPSYGFSGTAGRGMYLHTDGGPVIQANPGGGIPVHLGAVNNVVVYSAELRVANASGQVTLGATGDTALTRDGAADTLALKRSDNDQTFRIYGSSAGYGQIKVASTTVNAAAGATITASNLIPAGSLVLGVMTRVTTAFGTTNGLTSISLGDGTDVDRWGATTAITGGTTTAMADFTIASPVYYASATSVVITGNGGTGFDATGVIRVELIYMSLSAPTS